jgi:hypothetical protein
MLSPPPRTTNSLEGLTIDELNFYELGLYGCGSKSATLREALKNTPRSEIQRHVCQGKI